MSSTLIAALLSVCMFACICAAAVLPLVRLADQSVTFQLLTDNDLHRDIFLTPNIDGNYEYEYAVIIIRGIKTDGEFQSHSCVHLDCPEDLRLLVRRATVRNIRWNEDVTSNSNVQVLCWCSPSCCCAVHPELEHICTCLQVRCCLVFLTFAVVALRLWYPVPCLVSGSRILCLALVWCCPSITGSEASLRNVVWWIPELMNYWWIWRWWTLLNCGV